MSMETGSAVLPAMRRKFSRARSSGIFSPSPYPCAAATDQLPVASAFAPAWATALALPGSQTLNRTNGLPETCSAAKARALLTCSDMGCLVALGLLGDRITLGAGPALTDSCSPIPLKSYLAAYWTQPLNQQKGSTDETHQWNEMGC